MDDARDVLSFSSWLPPDRVRVNFVNLNVKLITLQRVPVERFALGVGMGESVTSLPVGADALCDSVNEKLDDCVLNSILHRSLALAKSKIMVLHTTYVYTSNTSYFMNAVHCIDKLTE